MRWWETQLQGLQKRKFKKEKRNKARNVTNREKKKTKNLIPYVLLPLCIWQPLPLPPQKRKRNRYRPLWPGDVKNCIIHSWWSGGRFSIKRQVLSPSWVVETFFCSCFFLLYVAFVFVFRFLSLTFGTQSTSVPLFLNSFFQHRCIQNY